MPSYDLIGSQELFSGADDLDDVLGAYDIVGRQAVARGGRRPLAARPAANAAMAAAMGRNAVILKERDATRSRRQYLPLGATVILSLASGTVTARPQSIAFKPERLVIPATIAPDFTIDQILVGVMPQAVQTGSAPAEAFVANAVDTQLDCDTVQTSQDLVVTATNISGATRTFRGTFFGRSAS
jgi:hypothetical protein